MKTIIQKVILFFLVFLFQASLGFAGINMSAKVEQTSVALSDKFILTIVIEWDGDGEAYLLKSFKFPDCQQIAVLESSLSSETIKNDKGVKTKSIFKVILQAIKEGDAQIGYASIDYLEKGSSVDESLRSEPLNIKVTPGLISKFNNLKTIGIAVVSLVIFLIIGVLLMDKFKKKNKKG